jgi:hypothetical protein
MWCRVSSAVIVNDQDSYCGELSLNVLDGLYQWHKEISIRKTYKVCKAAMRSHRIPYHMQDKNQAEIEALEAAIECKELIPGLQNGYDEECLPKQVFLA